MHGRWCGPGNSGPGAPVDPLDRACMDHDLCYQCHGWGAVQCDVELVRSIRRGLPRYRVGTRWIARLIVWTFTRRREVRKALRAR